MPPSFNRNTDLNPALFWVALAALLSARLLAMAGLPLMDTSEPRYAEMARVMAASNDWITPWFAPNVPFWGKPPLSFWMQALAIKFLGSNEFAVRLPSLLATLATLGLLYRLASALYGANVARIAILLCLSAPVMFVDAGAVLTDPFLVLGVTLSLSAFILMQDSTRPAWRWWFFIGLAIGLLSKGPLSLILIGTPVLAGILLDSTPKDRLRALFWWPGWLLMLTLTLPWYLAAEIKTPGFLRYFLIGEHVLRFIEPGWQGDLYGNGHARAKGMIWIYLIAGTLPWSLFLPGAYFFSTLRNKERFVIRAAGPVNTSCPTATHSAAALSYTGLSTRAITGLLIGWSCASALLFTPAGNILPTYIQPAIPGFCLLLTHFVVKPNFIRRVAQTVIALACIYSTATLIALQLPEKLKSERDLIATLPPKMLQNDTLLFLDRLTYSATFYSQGHARRVNDTELAQQLAHSPATLYLAIPKARRSLVNALEPNSGIREISRNPRYTLVEIPADKALRERLAPVYKDSGRRETLY
ncbi:Glycosyl transferase, family 39 protein [gamma proteobacterium HdN1]|nr:Glycosyl transferase, family 39 protein [gamma proteobacterium HdN1]